MYIFGNVVAAGSSSPRTRLRGAEGRTPEAIEERVNTLLGRQEALYRDEPPRIVAVFDRGVITGAPLDADDVRFGCATEDSERSR